MLLPSTKFLVRPVKKHGESLIGYVWRFYWENGALPPIELRREIKNLYYGINPEVSFNCVAVQGKFLEPEERDWWVTNRFDGVEEGKPKQKWLRFDYIPALYCPMCLEANSVHQELWTLPLVSVCPRHKCNLVRYCHACGKSLGWSFIKPGWICACGARVMDAPVSEGTPWRLQLAAVLDGALNPIDSNNTEKISRDVSHEIQMLNNIYGFLEWAYLLRVQLGRRQPYTSGPWIYYGWKRRTPTKPGAWEVSLFADDTERLKKRLRFLGRWTFRSKRNSDGLSRHVVPLGLGFHALKKLPRNIYTEKLLDEAEGYVDILRSAGEKFFLEIIREDDGHLIYRRE